MIGIDARLYGIKHAGIGRYVKNLTHALIRTYPNHHFHLIIHPENESDFQGYSNTTISISKIPQYTIREQLFLLKFVHTHKLNVFHSPHYTIPYISNVPQITTIHDLTWHKKADLRSTTLPTHLYKIKYTAYKHLVKKAVINSKDIIVPSAYVKSSIVEHFPNAKPKKIHVIPEAVDQDFANAKNESVEKIPNTPYIVYTGSLYPHKNLTIVLKSLAEIKDKPTLSLVIITARNIFIDSLSKQINDLGLKDRVTLYSKLSDGQVKTIYHHAKALIQPSLEEGFGLTGLEAMSQGLPVIASNRAALPEIYGFHASYFDPTSVSDCTAKLKALMHNPKNANTSAAKTYANKFSWEQAAQKTFALYKPFV